MACDSGREEAENAPKPPWDGKSEINSNGLNDDRKAERVAIAIEEGTWGKSAGDEAPREGEEAPEFSLKPLKFYGFKTEETDITEENAGVLYEPVALSSFRGKRPVALVFGSYT